MWTTTAFTQRLGLKLPIIQAPMAGITTPELVASVSNAGGLGSLAAGYLSPEVIFQQIQTVQALTDNPFAVNIFITHRRKIAVTQIKKVMNKVKKIFPQFTRNFHTPAPFYSFAEQIEAIYAAKPPVLSFTFGMLPKKWIDRFKQTGAVLIGTATCLSEAIELGKAGVDMIVAQGYEAGGHRGTFLDNKENKLVGSIALISQLAAQLNVPIIASGGMMNGRSILASLILGASGVQMGTAFITCRESGAISKYKKILLETKADHSILTNVFSGKYARGLPNIFYKKLTNNENIILPYPSQHALTAPIRAQAAKEGMTEYMALWAGQGASLCRNFSATDLLATLQEEVAECLKTLNTL